MPKFSLTLNLAVEHSNTLPVSRLKQELAAGNGDLAVKTIVISESHGLRLRTEEFIKDVYAKEYNAKLNLFPSKLIAMLDGQGDILCAAGLRSSDDGFFSECYLSTPIEVFAGGSGPRAG